MKRATSDTPNPDAEYREGRSPLKPILVEMMRTDICPKQPRFLVDKIRIVTQKRGEDAKEAFRLWLSDGEKSMQAVVKGQAHPYIIAREICVGSYVRLLKYELVGFPKLNGEGFVYVLAIGDLCADGHDGREWSDYEREEVVLDPAEMPPIPVKEQEQGLAQGEEGSLLQEKVGHDEDDEDLPLTQEFDIEDQMARRSPNTLKDHSRPVSAQSPQPRSLFSTPRKRKAPTDTDALARLDPNVSGSRQRDKKRLRKATRLQTPPKKTLEEQTAELRAKLMAVQSTPTKQRIRAATEEPSPSPLRQVKVSNVPSARKIQTVPAPEPPSSPSPRSFTRPVAITSLADVTGAKATRNKVHDFLAMVTHVNPRLLSRKGFPDSREMLIMDTSTTKQVHVTVFVNAANFLPKPGTIAVFRSLTTHEYNGGSLKAYAQRCSGKKWFIEERAGWQFQAEAEQLRRRFEQLPEIWKLPDRVWWTDRGAQRRSEA